MQKYYKKKILQKKILQGEKDNGNACVICFNKDYSIIFEPCMHICTRLECSKEIKKCPICNKSIGSKKRIYLC